jgi:NitT/TauT family transport system ATP-binding protein
MSIEARDISKKFGQFTALDNVSLEIPSGELVALLGPSGSGKTTLLRVIAGLEFADSGTVLFDGEDTTHRTARDRRVGFVFQHYALFRHMTVFENIAFGLRVRPRALRPSKEKIRARVEELLKLIQLKNLSGRYPSQLSGGQRQRVALARALAVEPSVLLLDEPFGSLDAQTRVIMQQILTNMWQRLKISVLFVTHDIDEAIFLSDRVYCMTARPGTIKAEIVIPLERPRHQSMMMSSEFLALRRGLVSLIREESLKAMGGEINDIALQGLGIEMHGESLAGAL